MQIPDITAFYSDQGIMPRSLLWSIPHRQFPSLYMLNGSWGWAFFLHMLIIIAALALLLGYRSRLACGLCWFLLLSQHIRNPWLLDAGHSELRLTLFWGMFMPLGERFAWDCRGKDPAAERYASLATLGYTLQIGIIYLFAAWNKTDPSWNTEHTALYYVLNQDAFATPIAHWLRLHFDWMATLTWMAMVVEWCLPVFLWLPPTRWLGLLLLFSLHGCIALLLNIGWMVPTALICSLGLFPWKDRKEGRQLPELNKGLKALLACCCVYILYINVAVHYLWKLPRPVQGFGFVLQLFQGWPMFAPHPGTEDGWWIIEGIQPDGKSIDLWRGGKPIDWTLSPNFTPYYPSQRWRCWLINMHDKDEASVLQYFLDWSCRGYKLRYARLIYVTDPTPPPGQPFFPRPIMKAQRFF